MTILPATFTYKVYLTRMAEESCIIEVEAEDAEHAQALASDYYNYAHTWQSGDYATKPEAYQINDIDDNVIWER